MTSETYQATSHDRLALEYTTTRHDYARLSINLSPGEPARLCQKLRNHVSSRDGSRGSRTRELTDIRNETPHHPKGQPQPVFLTLNLFKTSPFNITRRISSLVQRCPPSGQRTSIHAVGLAPSGRVMKSASLSGLISSHRARLHHGKESQHLSPIHDHMARLFLTNGPIPVNIDSGDFLEFGFIHITRTSQIVLPCFPSYARHSKNISNLSIFKVTKKPRLYNYFIRQTSIPTPAIINRESPTLLRLSKSLSCSASSNTTTSPGSATPLYPSPSNSIFLS